MQINDVVNTAFNTANRAVAAAGPLSPRRHTCPACGQRAAMLPWLARSGMRRKAVCASCGAMERHRLQAWILDRQLTGPIAELMNDRPLRILHFAPERHIAARLQAVADRYVTCDIALAGMDVHLDMCNMPFRDSSFDVIWASHVLEHIPAAEEAIAETYRILAPGGFAVLPVPIVAGQTIEYPHPVAAEAWHVRAPGVDFYDRISAVFDRTDIYTSADADESGQTWVYERRAHWPTKAMPYRQAMPGRRHPDAVPVAYKQ